MAHESCKSQIIIIIIIIIIFIIIMRNCLKWPK